MNYKILKKVILNEKHIPTDKTTHYAFGETLNKPFALQIVSFKNVEGYYLLYLNSKGEEMTDTFHESLEKAIEQANWEFNIKKEDWVEESIN